MLSNCFLMKQTLQANTANIHCSQQNEDLTFRGRKLVLNYTEGSPCPSYNSRRAVSPSNLKGLKSSTQDDNSTPENPTQLVDGGASPYRGAAHEKPVTIAADQRRKSTIISLLCERDPLAAKAAVSFVGASPDECTYFFELRSSAACPSVNIEKQQVGPSAVFGLV